MIAGFFPAPYIAVDIGCDQASGERWAEQQMVDAQAGIPAPGVTEIIPEGVDAFLRVQRAQRIGPALGG